MYQEAKFLNAFHINQQFSASGQQVTSCDYERMCVDCMQCHGAIRHPQVMLTTGAGESFW